MNNNSAYFKAFANNNYSDFKSYSDFQNTLDPKNVRYNYGNVSRENFNKHYSDKGWLGRKFSAIPQALWTGIIKTIFHLVKAIFIGIFKAFSDKGQYFKAQFFYIARNFQEVFGRIASIFNDRYGLYHIEASQFHKKMFDLFLTKQFKVFGDQSVHDLLYEKQCYATLGVHKNATDRDIKEAYNRLAKKYHPDKISKEPEENGDEFEARKTEWNHTFKQVKEAYKFIMKRKETTSNALTSRRIESNATPNHSGLLTCNVSQ